MLSGRFLCAFEMSQSIDIYLKSIIQEKHLEIWEIYGKCIEDSGCKGVMMKILSIKVGGDF